jgi:lambda family phage portal protein
MNWIDRAINFVSPQAGLRRVRARAIAEAMLSYEGVRSSRRQGGWSTSGSSGNAEIGVANSRLRSNARDLARNNAYGRKAKREWAKRVVGTGITPRPNTGNEKVNKTILEYWNLWAEQCCSDRRLNFYAAEKLIVSSCYESGETLVRLWDRRPEDDLKVPLQLQILEPDYIDESKTQSLTSGYIIQGVQFDGIGRILGYWLFGNHPGEVIQASLRGSYKSQFIPAQYILHHAEIERPGDVRAVSRFAAVIAKLRDIDEYADAEIVRKKIEACLVGMVTQPEGADGPTLASAAVDAVTGLKVEEFRPGMMMYGAPGADVKFSNPTAAGNFSEHKKTELREVATGLDIPYVVLDDNLEAVNYSSYRGGLLAFRDAIEEYRWNWLIPQVLNPVYRAFINKIWAMGAIPEPNYTVSWDPPPFDLLDREAEAKADRLELQIGKKSWPQLVGEIGNDPETQIKEIETWKSRLESAGVTFAQSTSDAATKSTDNSGGSDNAQETPGATQAE